MFAYTLIFGIFVIIAIILLTSNKNGKVRSKKINKIDFTVPGMSQANKEIANKDIQELMKFSKILEQHAKLGYKDSFEAGMELLSNIITIIDKIKESAQDASVSHDALSALAKYGNIIRKVNLLYGDKYFLYAKEHPSHWDLEGNPQFFDEIIQVIKNTNTYVIRDIQKFNKENIFDIKTAMASLSSTIDREAEEAIEKIFNKTQNTKNSKE